MSPEKPLKFYKSLSSGKGREQHRAFLIEGKKGTDFVVSHWPEKVMEVICVEAFEDSFSSFDVRVVSESQYKSISTARTPQGIAVLCAVPEDVGLEELPGQPGSRILLMEDIQDPGNTGTLIRSAAAFGFSGVMMSGKCADPFSPKCVQSTAGSVFSVWLRRNSSYITMVETLKKAGYVFASSFIDGEHSPSELSGKANLIVSVGNESKGISKRLSAIADMRITIPYMKDSAESLNVSVSGGILMHYAAMQFHGS